MKKWLKKQIALLSLAFSNVEKNLLSQRGEALEMPANQERRHNQGTLMDSLKQGQISQEVKELRWRIYKVLKASESINVKVIGYDEDNMPITQVTKSNKKLGLDKIKLDDSDTYPLEMVINNTPITISGNEIMNNENIEIHNQALLNYDKDGNVISATHGEVDFNSYHASAKEEFPIIVERTFIPKFEIEKYTKKLYIRKITEEEFLLEFHVSKYPDEFDRKTRFFLSETKKAINNPRSVDFLDINSVNFVTYKSIGVDDYLEFRFEGLKYDKITEFNGCYLIKFISSISINGIDITDEFKVEELDIKYENKEKRNR